MPKIRKFDTKVQYIEYRVLRELARALWNDKLLHKINSIPSDIIAKNESPMRCCIYKDRAIIQERIKIAIGANDEKNKNVIQVISIACDECPHSGYSVTDTCRGCMAHRCEDVCKFGAISYDENQRAVIDKQKCKNCGACAKVCPYSAIVNKKRPCENACKIGAISMSKTGEAEIDYDKCTSCGACVYQCPFGAVVDRSYILDVIDIIKESENNTKYKVYAAVAPSIAGQFSYAKSGQILAGIKELGFYDIVEVALGADMVSIDEAKEVSETKSFVTSSCCPAFVSYIEKNQPQLKEHISKNPSPMAMIGKKIKELDENAKVVFIGPCTAKKAEFQREEVKPYIDYAITFVELQALFDSRDIEISELSEISLDNASYFGRIFARSGGLTEAIREGLKENGCDEFEFKPVTCNGIEECKLALLKAKKGILDVNFIEGMACEGGCIGGAGCLTHADINKKSVDKYAVEAEKKTITQSIKDFQNIKNI